MIRDSCVFLTGHESEGETPAGGQSDVPGASIVPWKVLLFINLFIRKAGTTLLLTVIWRYPVGQASVGAAFAPRLVRSGGPAWTALLKTS